MGKLPQLRRMFPNYARHGQEALTHHGVQTQLTAQCSWYPDSRGSRKRSSDVPALAPGPPRIPHALRWPEENLPCPHILSPGPTLRGQQSLCRRGGEREVKNERKERHSGRRSIMILLLSYFFLFNFMLQIFSVIVSSAKQVMI